MFVLPCLFTTHIANVLLAGHFTSNYNICLDIVIGSKVKLTAAYLNSVPLLVERNSGNYSNIKTIRVIMDEVFRDFIGENRMNHIQILQKRYIMLEAIGREEKMKKTIMLFAPKLKSSFIQYDLRALLNILYVSDIQGLPSYTQILVPGLWNVNRLLSKFLKR